MHEIDCDLVLRVLLWDEIQVQVFGPTQLEQGLEAGSPISQGSTLTTEGNALSGFDTTFHPGPGKASLFQLIDIFRWEKKG